MEAVTIPAMTTDDILRELEAERDRLDQAIAALQKRRTGGRRRGQRLSPAARRRISEGMKRRWAERKKKAA